MMSAAYQRRVICRRKPKSVFSGNGVLRRLLFRRSRQRVNQFAQTASSASRGKLVEQSMRSLLAISIVGCVVVFGNAAVNAEPLTGSPATVPTAPIGHLQPRAQHFSPRSPAEQTQQQQMSIYDAQQQRLDEQLDKQLNICRGC
jgi:hypothetical protein